MNVKGTSCLEVTKPLELLGDVIKQKTTDKFYEQTVTRRRNHISF
ncbi:MAG: hypothetical protein ACTSSI_10150 [Candidatus Helarchaeota archaeon]